MTFAAHRQSWSEQKPVVRFGFEQRHDSKFNIHRRSLFRPLHGGASRLCKSHRIFLWRWILDFVSMPELPWRKWFPQDWKSDPQLSRCSSSTRGIWADAVSTMMQQSTYKLEGTDAELARDCRCSEGEIKAAHEELKTKKVAEVSMQNGCRIWICRRLQRECKIKDNKRKAADIRWGKTDAEHVQQHMQTPMQTEHAQPHAPSASVYASASVSASEVKPREVNGTSFYPELVRRLFVLFNRRPGDPMSHLEETTIFQISKRDNIKSEIAEIERFKTQELQYFNQKMITLIGDWQGALDRARNRPMTAEKIKRLQQLERGEI